jgi:hypothetical protein
MNERKKEKNEKYEKVKKNMSMRKVNSPVL